MRLLSRIAIVAGLVILPSGSGSTAAERLTKADRAAIAASPEAIADIAEVSGDELDTRIVISTEPFYRERGRKADKFFRAFIDKSTGTTSIQVYVWVRYDSDHGSMDFNRVNYESPSGVVTVDTIPISHRLVGCFVGGCIDEEDFAFKVPEETLRAVAAGARAGSDESWSFKVFGRHVQGETTGLLKTEAAGLLVAIDRLRTARNLPAVP